MYKRARDYEVSLCLWPLDTLEYGGRCSYSAVSEGISDLHDFTPEERAAQHVELHQKNFITKRERNKVYMGKRREQSPERVSARNRADGARHTAKHPEYQKDKWAKLSAADKASKKYHCEICDYTAGAQFHLAIHKRTKLHIHREDANQSSSKLD